MKKALTGITLALLLVAGVTLLQADPMSRQLNDVRVASLVNDMNDMGMDALESLEAIPMEPYTIPKASADVMRVRLSETYTVEGIGEDTVELTGWIAVRHGEPRLAPGETELRWGNFLIDTQFVGLKLEGESEIFGKVVVSLDGSRPAIGQVGRVEIPERAQILLSSSKGQDGPDGQTSDDTNDNEIDPREPTADCRAPVNVTVAMPDLDLEMKTGEPAVWHSRVTTIPPVGHEASVTIDPVALISEGREVGSLVSGTVKFREIVRKIELDTDSRVPASTL